MKKILLLVALIALAALLVIACMYAQNAAKVKPDDTTAYRQSSVTAGGTSADINTGTLPPTNIPTSPVVPTTLAPTTMIPTTLTPTTPAPTTLTPTTETPVTIPVTTSVVTTTKVTTTKVTTTKVTTTAAPIIVNPVVTLPAHEAAADTRIYTVLPAKETTDEDVLMLSLDNTNTEYLAAMVNHYKPAVFCLPYAKSTDVGTFIGKIGSYAYFGEADPDGYVNAVFFDPAVYSVVPADGVNKYATISLSGTPNQMLKHEKADRYATCSYALLKNEVSGKQIAVFCANFSTKDAEAREREMLALYSKYSCYISYFPTVVLGDFAFGEEDAILTTMKDGGKLTEAGKSGKITLFTSYMETKTAANVSAEGSTVPAQLFARMNALETPYHIDLNGKMVALTFDDGPTSSTGYTDKILDTLEAHNVKGTFFVTGRRLTSGNPIQRSLTARAYFLGFEIGNHTYSHERYIDYSSTSAAAADIAKADKLIAEVCGGMRATFLRPPTGHVKKLVTFDDRPMINWSVDTQDWMSSSSSEKVLESVKKDAKDLAIILMHDIHKRSPDAIEDILTYLESKGLQPVTVSEMMEFNNVQMTATHIYTTGKETTRTLYYSS